MSLLSQVWLLPKKLYLLVRYDVKQQLSSVWFYIILVGNSLLPPTWYLCYPENARFRVLMVDDLKNANFDSVKEAIEAEDFQVAVYPELRGALEELFHSNATLVVHVGKSGRVSWYAATPRLKKLFSRAIQASMLKKLNKNLDRFSQGSGQSKLILPLTTENFFRDTNKRHVSTATFMVRVTWYFTSLVTLTMFILARPFLSKLLRLFSMPMLLLAKVLAGLILGLAQMAAFLGMAWLAGFQFPDLDSYLLAYTLAILSGVSFGCLMGGIPLALTRDPLGLVFGALMGLSLTFMGFAQLSAFLTPISNMDPIVGWIDMANPLYNLNQVIYNCTYLGEALSAAPNPGYLTLVVTEALGCLLLALLFLLRL